MNKLVIGIDGYNLGLRHGTGVAMYGFALAKTLKNGGHRVEGVFGIDTGSDPRLREVLFFDLLAREPPATTTRKEHRRQSRRLLRDAVKPILNLNAAEVPLTDRIEKNNFSNSLPDFDRLTSAPYLFEVAFKHFEMYGRFVKVRMKTPPQIMHWTYPVPVEIEGARNIYTMHDLVPLRLPYTTMDSKRSYAALVERCAKRAAHICTVSEASRQDIIKEFSLPPDRVSNTYQTSSLPQSALALPAEEDARMVEGILGLPPKGYFLFFGAIEPKKNLSRLIEAYLSIQTDTPLVLVGSGGWQSGEQLRLLSNNGSPGVQRVIRLDFLPRPLLLQLVRGARAVTFPSLYEGFGLPVLEAMQFGTAVLTSTTSSLPEVAGAGALLVNPYSVSEIAAALRALDQDEGLRSRLGAAGLRQANIFSEQNYLQRLEKMYSEVLRGA